MSFTQFLNSYLRTFGETLGDTFVYAINRCGVFHYE